LERETEREKGLKEMVVKGGRENKESGLGGGRRKKQNLVAMVGAALGKKR